MGCEKCGNDCGVHVILPIKPKDGKSYEIVCRNCALVSPGYCERHQMPHLRFINGTACKICIEEIITENKTRAEKIYLLLKTELPSKEIRKLNGWAREAALIVGNAIIICLLRAVVAKALCLGVDIDEVIKRIIKAKSVDLILPNLF